MTLDFSEDGTVTGLASGEFPLEALGTVVSSRRVSQIWPQGRAQRLAFRLLRATFGDRGIVARWCRTWSCAWEVRLVADLRAVRFSSRDRQVCVEWEQNHLGL